MLIIKDIALMKRNEVDYNMKAVIFLTLITFTGLDAKVGRRRLHLRRRKYVREWTVCICHEDAEISR